MYQDTVCVSVFFHTEGIRIKSVQRNSRDILLDFYTDVEIFDPLLMKCHHVRYQEIWEWRARGMEYCTEAGDGAVRDWVQPYPVLHLQGSAQELQSPCIYEPYPLSKITVKISVTIYTVVFGYLYSFYRRGLVETRRSNRR